jgi:hypothetical protein
MSLAVSIYDVFAFTIPGFLYLFTFNELLRILGYSNLDVVNINFSSYWLPIILFAYLTGHLMEFVSLRLWMRLWYRVPEEERAYKKFLTIKPEEKIDFNPGQWDLLFAVIQREDRSTTERIDRIIALRIMLRNVSFGLFIFSLLNFYLTFQLSFSLPRFMEAIGLFALSLVSLRRADYYTILLYTSIFQHATLYGKNLREVLNAVRNEKPKKSRSKP